MSQHNEVHKSQNKDSMDISMVHNLPNKKCDKHVILNSDSFSPFK